MAHRVAQIDILNLPAVALEFVNYDVTEVLIVDGVVRAQGRGVVVEDHLLAEVGAVVLAEVVHELAQLARVLHVEGLQHAQDGTVALTGDQPVYVRVVVEGDGDRRLQIQVAVQQAAVVRAGRERIAGILERGVVVGDVGVKGVAEVGVEAVLQALDAARQDGRLEYQRREVALHLADVLQADDVDILEDGPFAIEDSVAAQLVDGLLDGLDPGGVWRLRVREGPAQLQQAGDGVVHFRRGLLAVVQQPAAALQHGHIAHEEHGVVPGAVGEIAHRAAVRREGLVFEFVVVQAFRFVGDDPVQSEGIRAHSHVLGDDDHLGAVVERDDVFVVLDRDDGLGEAELFRWALADDVVDAFDESGFAKAGQGGGQRARAGLLEG